MAAGLFLTPERINSVQAQSALWPMHTFHGPCIARGYGAGAVRLEAKGDDRVKTAGDGMWRKN